MVKGISRQVILVPSPDPKLFDQAIFILKEDMGEGVTDEALLKEAQKTGTDLGLGQQKGQEKKPLKEVKEKSKKVAVKR